MPMGGKKRHNPVSGDKLAVSGGGPRRNFRTRAEICKICSLTMKFMCFGRHEIIDFRTKSLEIPEWELFLEKSIEIGRPETGGRSPVAGPRPVAALIFIVLKS